MKKQKGMILFFSLIFLMIMTVIGVALAVNSSQSMKMAGAGSDRIAAMTSAQGAQERAIFQSQGVSLDHLKQTLVVENNSLGVTSVFTPQASSSKKCQRSNKPNPKIGCTKLEVSSTAVFGRKGLGLLTVVTGIEQEFIDL
ncbi:pilus assembly PilX family protein [Shewanella benthica]|uniref:Type 4 fimbrial biogenesis protein PilX N-terminal domain-containing protein n=1 Tax=Shewanella benthica KT99 TaxID=314608 RepID=A9DAW3_9GAMM|nr:pilus assembly PilX N-terminal domain-containing protein [Shewanella benthica]EDQ00653.1 hypothetical protein KT99_03869 [Shewanella benthica KT99]